MREREKVIDFNFEIYKKIYSVTIRKNLLKSAGLEIKKIIPKAQKFLIATDKNILNFIFVQFHHL